MVAGLHHCDICPVRTQIWFQSEVWASQEGIHFTPLHQGPAAQTLPDMFYKSSITSFFGAEKEASPICFCEHRKWFHMHRPTSFWWKKNYSFVLPWHMHTIILSSNFKQVYFSGRFRMDTQPHKPVIFSCRFFTHSAFFFSAQIRCCRVCVRLMNGSIFACVSWAIQQEGMRCANAVCR